MEENLLQHNIVVLTGRIISPLQESHCVYGETFYQFKLEVDRLSDCFDILPVTISERLLCGFGLCCGQTITLKGQIRSYNRCMDGINRLILAVFALELRLTDECAPTLNEVYLNGFLCKPPIYRTTPFKREICDLLFAVNRAYQKSDYIPCIAWGRNAHFCSSLSVGDELRIWGRFQSRNYQKKTEDGEITKVTYEVSVSCLERVVADCCTPIRDLPIFPESPI